MKGQEKELAEKKLVEWFGVMPTVLHVYELNGTYIYFVQFSGKLYVIRVFSVLGHMALSQDAMFYPKHFHDALPELEKQTI